MLLGQDRLQACQITSYLTDLHHVFQLSCCLLKSQTEKLLRELRALIDYVKAFTAFERAQGIILDGPNITIR